jgi:hypothetical protein
MLLSYELRETYGSVAKGVLFLVVWFVSVLVGLFGFIANQVLATVVVLGWGGLYWIIRYKARTNIYDKFQRGEPIYETWAYASMLMCMLGFNISIIWILFF